MAKWGEGDPRWIVEERPDATNVNNWHWTEKNASQWSKDKLTELFTGLEIKAPNGSCKVLEVSKCEGEAVANNRKAKLIFFYEWSLELKWEGEMDDDDETVQGKVEIPNLSEEHDPSDVDVTVTVQGNSKTADTLKEMMRKQGTEVIRSQLEKYISGLKKEFSQGMILPTKNTTANQESSVGKTTLNVKKDQIINGMSGDRRDAGVKLDVSMINLKESFKCTAQELYRALTVPEMVQAFTLSQCKIEAEKGGRFELFGGNVSGTFTELVPDEKICMQWRFRGWPDGHFSQVTIKITQKSDCTDLELMQIGVPRSEAERTEDGWRRHYWESMKRVFGFGVSLY
uniref:Putative activator of 90 kDa heat shock protein atpase log 1 n=1 Tax=Ornithodoros turicata TaxID=34597 RepID=A0A2R5LC81_9ACAR